MTKETFTGIDDDIDAFLLENYRSLANEKFGIFFKGAKVDVLKMKLAKMAGMHGLELGSFFNLLSSNNPAAIDLFLKEITVGHTYFFREREHFKILLDEIHARKMKDIKIWCAASSSGEEPYSLVISLLENQIFDFRILASDINKKALQTMHRGEFVFRQHQELDRAIALSYFRKIGLNTYRIREDLRSYLIIKQLNLHDEIELAEPVEFIFCRNVMIYFDEAGRQKVLKTLMANLKKGGLLFVGLSEAILETPAGLVKVGPAVFRKVF